MWKFDIGNGNLKLEICVRAYFLFSGFQFPRLGEVSRASQSIGQLRPAFQISNKAKLALAESIARNFAQLELLKG